MREAAKSGEPDRYLSALLAPRVIAADLMAVAACQAELARVPATVREPMMGHIRLQWWHDAIGAAAGGEATGHPVADAMRATMARHDLDRALLDAMIEARLADLGHDLFADDTAMLAHFATTEGLGFALALRIAGLPPGDDLDAAAASAGRAFGLARSLGRLPELARAGAFPIPASRLRDHAIDPEQLTAPPAESGISPAISACCEALRDIGRAELSKARAAVARLGAAAIPPLLPLAMVEPYFAVQEQMRASPLQQLAEVTPLGRLWRLWRAHRRQQF